MAIRKTLTVGAMIAAILAGSMGVASAAPSSVPTGHIHNSSVPTGDADGDGVGTNGHIHND